MSARCKIGATADNGFVPLASSPEIGASPWTSPPKAMVIGPDVGAAVVDAVVIEEGPGELLDVAPEPAATVVVAGRADDPEQAANAETTRTTTRARHRPH